MPPFNRVTEPPVIDRRPSRFLQNYQGPQQPSITSPLLSAPGQETPVLGAAVPKPGFLGGLGPEGQQALFRSILAAGNAIQRQADPEGRHSFTQLSTGLETGLNAFDTIRKAQKTEALAKIKRSKLEAAGGESDVGSALIKVGAETGDTAIIRAGADVTRATAPGAAPRPTVLGQGQTAFSPTGEELASVPVTPKAPGYSASGGVILNKATGEYEPIPQQTSAKANLITIDAGDRTVLYNAETGEQTEIQRGARPPSGSQKGKVVQITTDELDAFGIPIKRSAIEVADPTVVGGFRYLPPPTEIAGPPLPPGFQEPTGQPAAAVGIADLSPQNQARLKILMDNPKNEGIPEQKLIDLIVQKYGK